MLFSGYDKTDMTGRFQMTGDMNKLIPWMKMNKPVLRIGKQQPLAHTLHLSSDVKGYTLKLELNLDKNQYVVIDGLDVLNAYPNSLVIALMDHGVVRVDPFTRDLMHCVSMCQQIPASNIYK